MTYKNHVNYDKKIHICHFFTSNLQIHTSLFRHYFFLVFSLYLFTSYFVYSHNYYRFMFYFCFVSLSMMSMSMHIVQLVWLVFVILLETFKCLLLCFTFCSFTSFDCCILEIFKTCTNSFWVLLKKN